MTISKEERAELRGLVAELRELVASVTLPLHDFVADCDGTGGDFIDAKPAKLIASAVNAAPKLLDALDAADERIAGLEAEVAECHTALNERSVAAVEAGMDRLIASEIGKLETQVATIQKRIAELEAAAQWRPMATAPRDGTKILMSGRGPGGEESAVIQAADEAWLVAGDRYSDEALGIGHPEVVMGWLPIPALPEGGV